MLQIHESERSVRLFKPRSHRRASPTALAELLEPSLELDCEQRATDALDVMLREGLTCAPVVDDNHVLVGVVSAHALAAARDEEDVEVEDVMTLDAPTVPLDARLSHVARVMATHRLDRVPVVSGEGRLLGVVTTMDLMRWLADQLERR